MKKKSTTFTPPPVPYAKWKQLFGRFNRLYSMWQRGIEENNNLVKENALLKQQLNTAIFVSARPK